MVCTARARSQLYDLDGKWMLKFRLRIVQNILCAASIGAAGIVLGRSSSYQTNAWKHSRSVAYYMPFSIITFLWNIANIVFLIKKRRPLNPLVNAIVYFILSAVFIIVGTLATAYCIQGYKNNGVDPYGLNIGTGVHDIRALNGTIITVSSANAQTCPAFSSCEIQKKWTMAAGQRSAVALVGCVLFAAAFIFNVVFFIFGCNDAVYGTKPGTSESKEGREKKWQKVLKPKHRMTAAGRAGHLSSPTLGDNRWMSSQHNLLGETKVPFAQDNLVRSSLSLAIFSDSKPLPQIKSDGGTKSGRSSHGSIYAFPRPGDSPVPPLPTPPLPTYSPRVQSFGEPSVKYLASRHHSMELPTPTTPRFSSPTTPRFPVRTSSVPNSPRHLSLHQSLIDSTPPVSPGVPPLPYTHAAGSQSQISTRPSSLAPSIAQSIAPTIFERKSIASRRSVRSLQSVDTASYYDHDATSECASEYTNLQRLASFRSMPRISVGPDFSADWGLDLNENAPPVPAIPSESALPSRSVSKKSTASSSQHVPMLPLPQLPRTTFGLEVPKRA
ncbi:hypothetical protein EJ08DRAFT_179980 [Tothia fuscella]|uniref:MARVEL domain-containing protein n=1 Tax=Tothia fuscella TaxID=1048955 RepID=A0A9P4NU90_9PEZI|nr:hypothetical protein EJ08DRAFT_179980 [Tothia fuscella]